MQIIKDLFYTHPIDALRVIITKYFFSCNKKVRTTQDLLQDKEIRQMMPGFIDMDKFMARFREHGKCDEFVNIVKFLNIETLTNSAPHAVDMSGLIVFQHISEPLFRILMLNIFYAKYPDMAQHALKGIQRPEALPQLTWSQAPVQLCSNVHMDDANTLVFANQEFRNIYKCQVSMLHVNEILDDLRHPDVEFLKRLANQGIRSFKKYGLARPFVAQFKRNVMEQIEIYSKFMPTLAS